MIVHYIYIYYNIYIYIYIYIYVYIVTLMTMCFEIPESEEGKVKNTSDHNSED